MKESKPSLIYGFIAVISIFIGPFCLLIRGSSASSVEKFVYIISLFPLGLIAFQVRYLLGKRALMETPDSEMRRNAIQMLTREHKQLVLFVLAGAIFVSALYVWIIFVWMPTRI
jgi:hypothetical protein